METVRSVRVHVEVDTNKDTYELDLDVENIDFALEEIRDFITARL